MKLYNSIGETVIAKAVPQPKFAYHRGRTWDVRSVSIDGEKLDFHYDSSWGRAFYFRYNGRWYTAPVFDHPYNGTVGVYESRRLFTKKPVSEEV